MDYFCFLFVYWYNIDIFRCFGMKDIAKELLKNNEIRKMREQVVRSIKHFQ